MPLPAYDAAIDSGNALASYVEWCTWCADGSALTLTDVSGNAYHGTCVTSNRDNTPVVLSGTYAAYNGTYERLASDKNSAPAYQITGQAKYLFYYGGGWWVTTDSLDHNWTDANGCYASGTAGSWPWDLSWVRSGQAVTAARGTTNQSAEWTAEGLQIRSTLPERVSVPIASGNQPGSGDFSFVFDYEVVSRNLSATTLMHWTGGGKTIRIYRWDSTGVWSAGSGADLVVYFHDGTTAITATLTNSTARAALEVGEHRLVLAFDRDANLSVWDNGTSCGTAAISTASASVTSLGSMLVGAYDTSTAAWGMNIVLHEAYYLKGYAITSSDVSSNAAVSTLYGLVEPEATTEELAGAATGTATMTGSATLLLALAGAASGTATMTGAFFEPTTWALAGAAIGNATMAGGFVPSGYLRLYAPTASDAVYECIDLPTLQVGGGLYAEAYISPQDTSECGVNQGLALALFDGTWRCVLWARATGVNIDGEADVPLTLPATSFTRVGLWTDKLGNCIASVDGEEVQRGSAAAPTTKVRATIGTHVTDA